MQNETSKTSNSSIQRVLQILEIVAGARQAITATEINRHLNLPKPTIHRLCAQLVDDEFIQSRLDGRGFVCGKRLNSIALSVLSNNDFQTAQRHRILENLSNKLGETCNIAVLDGDQSLYYDRIETHWPLRAQLQINDKVPLHCTASGKLFLSELSSVQRSRLLQRLPLARYTDNTLTSAQMLKPELSKTRKQQVGIDNEEFFKGMIAVAVPIRDKEKRMFAALAVHAPTARLTLDKALLNIPLMRQAARDLADLMAEA
ncbi:MAG: IclR family acetate operon transcriptional repressor [Oceanospirillaceae bacterium]|jgi:IclR family acetate operon transcriptional repressor